jgi:hypothetical protein
MNFKKYAKKSLVLKELIRAYRNQYKPNWRSVENKELLLKPITKPAKRILIATGGGGYAAAKQIESLLSASLTLRGANVDVLICDGILPACFQTTIDWDSNELKFSMDGTSRLNCYTCYKGAENTYSAINANLLKFSEYITDDDNKNLAALSDDININELTKYSIYGIGIGEHATAGALRFYAKASLTDRHSEKVLRRYFHAALLTHLVCEKLYSKNNYDHLVLHHGIYVPQGIISETAMKHSIPTTTWHVAYRKKCFVFSHGGTYHKTLMSEALSNWENIEFSEEKKKKIIGYLASRWNGTNDQISFSRYLRSNFAEQVEFCNGENRKSILMLTNVLWDAQLHYPNNAFKSMMDWIIYTIKYFSRRTDLILVIRIHPAEISGTLPSRQKVNDEIEREIGPIPENIKIVGPESGISTYKLAEACDCALIYGTKTGVELTAMGIPTVVAGEAWIRGKGVSIDVSSPEEYFNTLEQLPLNNRLNDELKERALKYAYHFFFRRMIYVNSIKNTKSHASFDYNFKDVKQIMPGVDKGLDAICDGILYGKEFIYEDGSS